MKKTLGLRKNALIEMVSILAVLTGISVFFGDGTRFLGAHPHPFWIVVLLMIVQYGTIEGLVATFLSTICLYFWNMPHQLVEETAFDYQFRVSFTPFLWFSASFVLGELRMRLQGRLDEMTQERDDAKEHSRAITKNYEVLKIIKENLEARMAGQVRTVAATYETVKELESLNPVQILMGLERVVQTALSPTKFSVYASGPNGLEATTSHGWVSGDTFLRRFNLDHPIFKEITINKRMISVINKEDEETLSGEGVMAAPLIDCHSGEVFGMLKLEQIEFFRLDIGNLETFKTLCDLIGSAYSNAKKYKEAMTNAIYVEGVSIFSYNLYDLQKGYLENLAAKSNSPLSNLTIRLKDRLRLTSDEEQKLLNTLYESIMENLPEGTPLFHGKSEKIHFELILPATSVAETEVLSHSIFQSIQQNPELKNYTFLLKVEEIFDPIKVVAN